MAGANYDLEFDIKANLDKQSLNKVEKEITGTVAKADKAISKVKTSLEVSQGKQNSLVKDQREKISKLGISDTRVKLAEAAVHKYIQQLYKVADIETQINNIKNDQAYQKDLKNTQSRLAYAKKQRDSLLKEDKNADVSSYDKKIQKETAHLEELRAKIQPLQDKLDGARSLSNDFKTNLVDVTRQFEKAGLPAQKIFDLLGITVGEATNLTSTTTKATSALNDAAVASGKLAATEAKTSSTKAKSIATTKKEDDSLRGLLKTYNSYIAELTQAQKEGKNTADIEQKIATTANKINDKFQFSSAEDGIAGLIRRLQELMNAKKALESANIPMQFSDQYNKIFVEIERTKQAIQEYKRSLQTTTEEHGRTEKSGVKMGGSIKGAWKAVKLGISAVKAGISNVSKLVSSLKAHFKGLATISNKVKSSFDSMARNMKSNFKHLITSITKYVFGFRSLFFLVRRLRKYLGEGIQNLVQFQGGDNRLNDMISRLLSSLLFLKNAWAAAFEPVITVVGPILEQLIDMVAQAGNAIARFIGALTGQKIVFNAVKVSAGNYAEKLSGVGDSAGGAADKVKKLTDRLAAFDDLDVLGKDDDDDSGLGGGGGSGLGDGGASVDDMFEIVDAQSTLADMIKEAWKNADFTEVGKYVRDKIYNALMGIDWDFIQEIARKVAKSFGTFLNGLLGDPKLWVAIGHTIAESLNTITYAIDEFLLTIKDTDFGGSFAQGINRMFTDIDWETIKSNIINFFDTLKNNIKSFLAGLNWEDTFVSAESGIPGEGQAQTGILTAVKTLFEGIGTAIQSIIGDSEFMGEIGAALGNLINAIIVAWQAVCETTDGTEIGNAILEFFKKFFATVKFDILADDITDTVNGIVDMLVAQLDGLDGKEVGQSIWDFFERIIANLDTEDLGKVVSKSLVLGLDLITRISEEIAKPENKEELENKIREFIKGLDLSSVFEALGENINASTSAANAIASVIVDILGDPQIATAITDGLNSLFNTLNVDDLIDSFSTLLGKIIVASFNGVAIAEGVFNGVVSAIGNGLINWMQGGVDYWDENTGDDSYGNVGSIFIHGILGGIAKAILENPIGQVVQQIFDQLFDEEKWAEETERRNGIFEQLGKDITEGFKNGLLPDENIFEFIDRVFFTPIKEAFEQLFKIGSPSKVAEEWGGYIVEGLKIGIENLIDTVLEPFDKLKEDLIGAWEQLKIDAEEKWGLVKDAITGAVETVQTDVEEKWGLIETAVTTAWDNVSTKTQEVWDGMKTKITEEVIPAISEFVTTNLPTIVTTIQDNWETIRTNTEEKWDLVKGYVIDKFGEAKTNIEENMPLFQEFVSTTWDEMSENARIKWDEIKGHIIDKFKEAKENVINKAREMYNKISGYWDDLKRSTHDKFTQIKNSVVNIFEAMGNAIKSPLNKFISAIENMVNFVIDGINKLMDAVQAFLDLGSEWLAKFGLPEVTVTHLEHVSLPRLAQGAVIPPNNEFLAVLGDQSHGTNIEAPLDTIKQAVAEVLANNNNQEVIELLQQLIQVVENKNLTIGDKEIGKANARYTNKQNIIRGTSF